jgi:hypothetical protein
MEKPGWLICSNTNCRAEKGFRELLVSALFLLQVCYMLAATKQRTKNSARVTQTSTLNPDTNSEDDEREESQEEVEEESESQEEEVAQEDGEKIRQGLRLEYRKLLNEVNDSRDTISSQALVTSIKAADKLFEKVNHTREATLDYEFTDLAMQIAVNNANKLTTGFKGYSIDQCVDKMNALTNEANFYQTFIREFVIRETPSRVFLYGGLDVKQKEKVVREKKAKDLLQEKVNPKIVEQNKKEELDMTKRVKKIFTKLQEETTQGDDEEEVPVDAWSFINEPASFATTVENLFHFSFLVHEGAASITKDEKNADSSNYVINTATPPKQQGIAPEDIKNQQCVIKLDYKLWQENSKRAQENNNNNQKKKNSPQKKQKKQTDT